MSRILLAPLALLIALIALTLPKRVLSNWAAALEARRIPVGEATDLDVDLVVL